jgi:hypothetical protein
LGDSIDPRKDADDGRGAVAQARVVSSVHDKSPIVGFVLAAAHSSVWEPKWRYPVRENAATRAAPVGLGVLMALVAGDSRQRACL